MKTEDTIQTAIQLLGTYWQRPGELDARTRNYCRMLADIVLGILPAAAREQIKSHPEAQSKELSSILDRILTTDVNARELIQKLLPSAKPIDPKSQSVKVSGNNNQVITVGGNLSGGSIVQNNFADTQSNATKVREGKDAPEKNIGGNVDGYEKAVFISYAWGGDSGRIADELEQAFAKRGIHIVRDIKDLEYKGSVETFEQRIGRGQCVILVVSDKYLRSEHCMFELVEADSNRDLRQRIFPIVLPDAHIYKPRERLAYIKYWEARVKQLNQAIKKVDLLTNITGFTADLEKYARIRASFDHLTDLLADMNALTLEMHSSDNYSTLIEAVERALRGE